ncbi:MAG: hypothetical protein ABIZ95_11330 [Pyrinomonadaceae bacterium]
MFYTRQYCLRIITTGIITLGLFGGAIAQNSQCDGPKKPSPPFRVGRTERPKAGPVSLILQIRVESKYFNRDDMTALGRKLQMVYGKKEVGGVIVLICDDYKVAKYDLLVHDLNTGQADPGLRGLYGSNPAQGKPGIEFSTARGRALDEISITLDDH